MPLQLEKFSDPHNFYDTVIAHLLRNEAECCLQIGMAKRLAENGPASKASDYLDQPLLWTVQDGREIELVAIQTLKKTMTVTRGSPAAMDVLAEAMLTYRWAGASVVGLIPSIGSLVERYTALASREANIAVKLRVFQLEQVTMPKPAGGCMRPCEIGDRVILAQLIAGFQADTNQPSTEDPLVQADRAIAGGRWHVWTDPEPVAVAAGLGPTPNGIRIGAVYTRPGLRGRGYASNLVATLSQQLLDQGRRFCFLFTDLANPTSNRIYQKIGYKPVCDSERWEFV